MIDDDESIAKELRRPTGRNIGAHAAMLNKKPVRGDDPKRIAAYANRVGEQSRVRGKRPITLATVTLRDPEEL